MRRALALLAVGVAVTAVTTLSAGAAASCRATPTDAGGPFGRGEPPIRSKIGTGHVLTGVVLSALDCRPIRGARVQFWQAGKNGRYTTAGSATVVTGRDGRFRFEGPYPPSYRGVPPHIHIRVHAGAFEELLTRYQPPAGAKRGNLRLVLVPAEL